MTPLPPPSFLYSIPALSGQESRRFREGGAQKKSEDACAGATLPDGPWGVAPQCFVGDVVFQVRTPPGWAGGGLGFPEGGAQLKMEPARPHQSGKYAARESGAD